MKSIYIMALGLVAAGLVASGQETKEAKIERILALTNSTATIDQMFDQIKAAMTAQASSGATPEQRAKVQETMGKMMDLSRSLVEKVRPQLVQIYADNYSDQEIDGLLAFYQSPAGRAMVQKTPALTVKIMGAMQSQMSELMPEVRRIAQEAIGQNGRPVGTTAPPVFTPPPGVPGTSGAYRIGGGVSAPMPTYQQQPGYTEEARAGKLEGSVRLSVVVDENGNPRNVVVVKPLGLGLDEKAVEAVQNWRFKPGMKDGQPVPVEAIIDVTFHLVQR